MEIAPVTFLHGWEGDQNQEKVEKMEFIHSREHLDKGNIVVVDCDTQCNVMLLTDSEFSNYRRGQRFNYYGGHYKFFPVRISVPNTGYWNITIDLGGGSARIKYSINVIKS